MSKEIKAALTEIALQLQEQLKFYSEIGINDIGDSLRLASSSPVARITLPRGREENLTPETGPKTSIVAADAAPPHIGLFADLPPAASAPKSGLPIIDFHSTDPSLEAIRADIGDCTRCKLHEHRTRIVFGEGNPQAELMFVGEGPGADEDLTGRPFVGRAGQLLDKIIAAIGKKREDVYIANVVKCRPPQNRTPERDEVDTCQPFLYARLPSSNPK